MRRMLSLVLLACCTRLAPHACAATPLLASGPARSQTEEQANKLIALTFDLTLFGDQDPLAAERYLAADFLNHDVTQPSGARTYASYFLNPAAYGNPDIQRPTAGPLPQAALERLFAITEDDLTMLASAGGSGSKLFETKAGRITQIWTSGPSSFGLQPNPPASAGAGSGAGAATLGRLHVTEPGGAATRSQRAANKQLVADFIAAFFLGNDPAAAQRYLAPDLHSHVAGVASGATFAIVAHKHPDRVIPLDMNTPLFALADGNLVAVGFPVPHDGDPGARYAQIVLRIVAGKITDWWYAPPAAERLGRAWHKPAIGPDLKTP